MVLAVSIASCSSPAVGGPKTNRESRFQRAPVSRVDVVVYLKAAEVRGAQHAVIERYLPRIRQLEDQLARSHTDAPVPSPDSAQLQRELQRMTLIMSQDMHAVAESLLSAKHQQVTEHIQSLGGSTKSRLGLPNYVISASLPEDMIPTLRNHPEVRSVELDKQAGPEHEGLK